MEDHCSKFSVEKMCAVFHVSRSGYYKWRKALPSKQQQRKEELTARIIWHFHDTDQRYGSPRIWNELKNEGWDVSERTVGKIMREHGLRSCMAKKFRVTTTDSNHDNPIAPNLLAQNFSATKPGEKWVADITYIPCREGKMYLSSVMDLYTKEIVGWVLSDDMTKERVIEALKQAYAKKQPKEGLIHHSDRGAQYASDDYRELLNTYRMKASMSRKGNCYDNACIEAFHSILKRELIYCTPTFRTKQEARESLFRYIEFFYNCKRTHSTLGYLSPLRFEQQYYNQTA
ncbi:IS3 family transposase, partial [Paenibacillus ferrarius]|uniref:IS3 family transposase n=1 Tax=Paenibacillus ferrarius TaxID=1469647 RepID=UPI003D2CE287